MRRGLNHHLLAGSIVLLVLVAGAFAVTLVSVDRLSDANRELQLSLARIAAADRLERLAIDAETGQRGFIITGDDSFLTPYEDARDALPAAESALLGRLAPDDERRLLASRAIDRVNRYVDVYVQDQIDRAREDPAAARAVVAAGNGKRQVDAIRADFAALETSERTQARQIRSESDTAADRARTFALLGLIGAPILVLLYAGYLSRLVVAPIRRVAAAARRRGAGEFDARADERGVAEAGALARAFNSMADAAQHSRDELENQNAELEAQQGELERTLDALAEETANADAFHRTVAEFSSATELDELASVLLTTLGDVLAADAGTLYTADVTDVDGPLVLAGARGFEALRLPQQLAPGAGLAGRALLERRVVSADHGEGGLTITTFGGDAPVRHELHVPLFGPTRVAGVMSFMRVASTPFSERSLALVRRLGEPAAVALTRALTYQYSQHSARMNQAVLETAQDAFLAIDGATTEVLEWSPKAEAMFGYSTKEALGVAVADLIAPGRLRRSFTDWHDELLANVERGAAATHRVELTACGRDRGEFLIELSLVPVLAGERWRVNGFVRDITARKLRERERDARAAVSRVLAEVEGRETLVEPVIAALCQSLHWPLASFWIPDESAEGKLRCAGIWSEPGRDGLGSLAERLSSGSPSIGVGLIGSAWEKSQPAWARVSAETSARSAAAADLGLRVAAAVPIGHGRRALGVLEFWQTDATPPDSELFDALDAIGGVVVSVAERRRAEAEAERLKNEFFALVSHELRTPLTSIVGYLELVLEGEVGEVNDQQERFLGIVDRNARRLQRLVGDLLFVAQVEAGTLSLDAGRAALDTIVENAVEAARPRAEQGQVTVVADAEPVPEVEGDADRLGQLVDNLLNNALKFTPAGGEVTVALRNRGDVAELSVTDTGIGIPPAEQASLFDRFYRASTAVAQEIPGIGLGLSICQAIAEGHGGRIEVESEVGVGTTFRVTLPLQRIAVNGAATNGATPHSTGAATA